MTKEDAIKITKGFRVDADNLLQRMKEHAKVLSRINHNAFSKAEMATYPEDGQARFAADIADDCDEAIAQHTISIRDLESAIMRQSMTLIAIDG